MRDSIISINLLTFATAIFLLGILTTFDVDPSIQDADHTDDSGSNLMDKYVGPDLTYQIDSGVLSDDIVYVIFDVFNHWGPNPVLMDSGWEYGVQWNDNGSFEIATFYHSERRIDYSHFITLDDIHITLKLNGTVPGSGTGGCGGSEDLSDEILGGCDDDSYIYIYQYLFYNLPESEYHIDIVHNLNGNSTSC